MFCYLIVWKCKIIFVLKVVIRNILYNFRIIKFLRIIEKNIFTVISRIQFLIPTLFFWMSVQRVNIQQFLLQLESRRIKNCKYIQVFLLKEKLSLSFIFFRVTASWSRKSLLAIRLSYKVSDWWNLQVKTCKLMCPSVNKFATFVRVGAGKLRLLPSVNAA